MVATTANPSSRAPSSFARSSKGGITSAPDQSSACGPALIHTDTTGKQCARDNVFHLGRLGWFLGHRPVDDACKSRPRGGRHLEPSLGQIWQRIAGDVIGLEANGQRIEEALTRKH